MSKRMGYRCTQCGHTWIARNPYALKRECSKCRSQRVVEDKNEERTDWEGEKDDSSQPRPNSILTSATVIEEIRAALMRLDGNFKMVMAMLEGTNGFDSKIREFFESYCIWCGAVRNKGMTVDDRTGRWVCRSCGRYAL